MWHASVWTGLFGDTIITFNLSWNTRFPPVSGSEGSGGPGLVDISTTSDREKKKPRQNIRMKKKNQYEALMNVNYEHVQRINLKIPAAYLFTHSQKLVFSNRMKSIFRC